MAVIPNKLAGVLILWVNGCNQCNFSVTLAKINEPKNINQRFQSTFLRIRWGLIGRVISKKLATNSADSAKGKPVVKVIINPVVIAKLLYSKGLKRCCYGKKHA